MRDWRPAVFALLAKQFGLLLRAVTEPAVDLEVSPKCRACKHSTVISSSWR
jgi:hypothetical protein